MTGNTGSKCNVVSVFKVANFGCLQVCHCPMVCRIQKLAQVVCEKRVKGSVGIDVGNASTATIAYVSLFRG